jgi:hypothetical protein
MHGSFTLKKPALSLCRSFKQLPANRIKLVESEKGVRYRYSCTSGSVCGKANFRGFTFSYIYCKAAV